MRSGIARSLLSLGSFLALGCQPHAGTSTVPQGSRDCSETHSCAESFECCSGVCVDLTTSHDHCGACGSTCEFPHACSNGVCTRSACDSGFAGGLVSGEACADDARAGFSPSENPAGTWSYGWAASRSGEFQLLGRAVHDVDCGSDVWHVNPDGSPPSAHVYQNTSGEVAHCAGTTTVEPGWVIMHPGPSGEVAILRYTAFAPGSYRIDALFEGVSGHGGAPLSSTDSVILVDDEVVFSAGVNIPGWANSVTFTATTSLWPGTVVDLELGDGGNGWGYDGTRVEATITWVGAPTARCFRDRNCPEGFCVERECQIVTCDGINYATGPLDSPNGGAASSDPAGVRIGGAGAPNDYHPVLYAGGAYSTNRYVLTGRFAPAERGEFGVVFGAHAYGGFLLGSEFGRVDQVWLGEFAGSWNPAPRFRGPAYTMVAGQTYVLRVLAFDQEVRGKIYDAAESEPDWQVEGQFDRPPEGQQFGAYVYQSPDVVLTSLELCTLGPN